MTSPTQRTRDVCKERGWASWIVEKFVRFPPPGHRSDMFGFIDIVALTDTGDTLAIQCTSTGGASRQAKIEDSEYLPAVLNAGWYVEVWTWRKTNDRKAGKRKTWALRRVRLVGPSNWEELEA